jgi:hypothetical protein
VTAGAAVDAGGVLDVGAVTTELAFEDAVADPAVFVACTAALSVEPTIEDVTTIVELVAPEIELHDPPLELQSDH